MNVEVVAIQAKVTLLEARLNMAESAIRLLQNELLRTDRKATSKEVSP